MQTVAELPSTSFHSSSAILILKRIRAWSIIRYRTERTHSTGRQSCTSTSLRMCLLFLQPCRSGNVLPNQEFFPPDPQQKNCAQRLKIFDRSRLGVLCPGSEFGLSWEAGGTNPGNSDPAQIQHGPNKE